MPKPPATDPEIQRGAGDPKAVAKPQAAALADAAVALGADGPVAHHLEDFAPRLAQQQMASAVARVLMASATLVVEAGTGTGKTFGYLVPALLARRRVIISTGTRTLQDQLYHRDLPRLSRALGVTVSAALLKGRANYLCHHRLERAVAFDRRDQDGLARIRAWAGRTRGGDIDEIVDVPADSSLWPQVTSTADNCLGAECPQLRHCFVVKARREAMEAELVVVNHHLFCADLVLRDDGFGEVLPTAEAWIFDEAHQLPEVASQFFGQRLSSRQVIDLLRDARAEQRRDAKDFVALAEGLAPVEAAVVELRAALGDEPRVTWQAVAQGALPAAKALAAALDHLGEALQLAAERGKGLAACAQRCQLLRQRLTRLAGLEAPGLDTSHGDAPGGATGVDSVRWCEVRGRGFALWETPLDVGEVFRQHRQRLVGSWVFTSATLAVGTDFDHFTHRLGLGEAETLQLDSPFDYPRQGLLYHPQDLPDPSHGHYTEAVLEAALPVLTASHGRAFLLFTSHRALHFAAQRLAEPLAALGYPLLVQGDAPRGELLARFGQLGNAVLLGTSSFWEGVDVRGDALSLVVIDRLPFAAPSDPVLSARLDTLRRRGGDPFVDYQLPQAVIALKQGAGRLIRDPRDRGVLMVCDPRLTRRRYGRAFLDSLPPLARTRSLQRVQEFFARDDGSSTGAEVLGVGTAAALVKDMASSGEAP